MEGNEENQKTESEIKQETVNTINTAKEQMKNLNFKAEAETGKGLIKKLWKDPVEAIKEIVSDGENKFFKTAILLVGIWAVIVLIKQIIYYTSSKYLSFNLLATIKAVIAPILEVIAMTAAIYIINKNAKKSFISIITAISVAKVPLIISSLLGFLTYIGSGVHYITTPISGILSVISTLLVYFAVKFLTEEEDVSKAFKAFVKVEAIYYIIYFVLSFLGIYI